MVATSVAATLFVIAAARGAACFGEGQTAAGSPRAAEGRGSRAPAHALRVADVRSSMACNSPVSSAGHIVHALVQLAVRGCRLGDALMRRLRATMHGQRASDLIQSTLSRLRPHYTCVLSAAVVGIARRQHRQSGNSSRWTDRRCSAEALHECSCIRPRCAARHRAGDARHCLKRVQTVRYVRAMRARSNTRTACHCTAWSIDPSQPWFVRAYTPSLVTDALLSYIARAHPVSARPPCRGLSHAEVLGVPP